MEKTFEISKHSESSNLTGIQEDVIENCIQTAINSKINSYSPYSKFRVGAAILTQDGKIFQGVNVENVSYGVCICAERSGIVSAISNGSKNFTAVFVTSDLDSFLTPCGACRQVIAEFDFTWIFLVNCSGQYQVTTIEALLPKPALINHLKQT